MPTRACFGFGLPDFCEIVSGLCVVSVEAEPALVLLVLVLPVEDPEVVPAAALVTIPILERHEVKKIPAAEEATNNIKFFLFILPIFLKNHYFKSLL